MTLFTTIPEGVAWGDYFYDMFEESEISSISEEGEWETVEVSTQPIVRAPRWCRNGNACQWANCKFRHEVCEHHQKWVVSKGRTRGCRCLQTDPHSCKSPEEGGCKYDHRDHSKLEMFVETVELKTESDLWEKFADMEARRDGVFDVSQMSGHDVRLLIRSLEKAGIEFEDNQEWFDIKFEGAVLPMENREYDQYLAHLIEPHTEFPETQRWVTEGYGM